MKAALVGLLLVVSLSSGVASGGQTEPPPVHCGIDSCWGPGTCQGVPGKIYGTGGKDRIVGTSRDDVIVALGGDDRIRGRAVEDLICGDGGDDFISGGKGEDGKDRSVVCSCGPADGLYGGSGRDVISGNGGDDGLYGGGGGDSLQGGPQHDLCAGGGPQDDEFPNGDLADGTCEETRNTAEI